MIVGQMNVGQMIVGQMIVGQMIVGQMIVGQMTQTQQYYHYLIPTVFKSLKWTNCRSDRSNVNSLIFHFIY